MDNNSKIVENGADNYRRSKTYRDKVDHITRDIETKYKFLLDNETNFFKRFVLKIKMKAELRREISKLTSLDKMFAATKL